MIYEDGDDSDINGYWEHLLYVCSGSGSGLSPFYILFQLIPSTTLPGPNSIPQPSEGTSTRRESSPMSLEFNWQSRHSDHGGWEINL